MGPFQRLHENPDAFREALSFTEAACGFSQRLIEKDYYCSLILADFEPLFADGLVFKGGTCLSKVHADFYRLSEDLDFAVSISPTARRRDRRRVAAPFKPHFGEVPERLPALHIASPLEGHDNCRQYRGVLRYTSIVTGECEKVKVEVAVREPVIEATVSCVGRTLLRHPVQGATIGRHPSLCVLSLRETYAEKVRAALTRDPPAIRDIFDIAEAVRTRRLDLCEPRFLKLVQQKLTVPGNAQIDTSATRKRLLENQLETDLKPVLRTSDYAIFDMERAFADIERLAALIRGERLT